MEYKQTRQQYGLAFGSNGHMRVDEGGVVVVVAVAAHN